MARGSIQRTSSNTYRIRVEITPDPGTGKRRWHTETLPTKRKAEARVAEILTELEGGRYARVQRQTLASYLLDVWLPYYRTSVRPSTIVNAETRIRRHVVPHIGAVPLGRLQPVDVQMCYTRLREGGLKDSTVRAVHQTLTSALTQAVRWEILTRNPAKGVRPGRLERRPATLWTHDEVARFLTTFDDRTLYAVVCTVVATSIRRGEVLALQWRDVDLVRGTLHIQRTLTRLERGWGYGPPKSERSRRLLPIPDELIGILQTYQQEQRERRALCRSRWPHEEWVFDRGDGHPLGPDALHHRWVRAVQQAHLPKIRLHDLRHGGATKMLEAGIPLKVISEHLGHSTITTTADIYQHVTQEMHRRAAEALGGFLPAPGARPGRDLSTERPHHDTEVRSQQGHETDPPHTRTAERA
jgi:integrase